MRFSLFAAGAFATSALAAPALSPEKRQVGNVLSIVQATYKQVTEYTSVINSTLDSVKVDGVSAAGVNVSFVEATVKTEIAYIVDIIDSVLNVTAGLSVIDDVDSVISLITSITGGLPVVGSTTTSVTKTVSSLPVVGSILKRAIDALNLNSVTDLTKGLPVVGRDVKLPVDLSSVTGLTKDLPVRQIADTSSVTSYATAIVSEITSTVGGVSKVVPGGESIFLNFVEIYQLMSLQSNSTTPSPASPLPSPPWSPTSTTSLAASRLLSPTSSRTSQSQSAFLTPPSTLKYVTCYGRKWREMLDAFADLVHSDDMLDAWIPRANEGTSVTYPDQTR